MDKHDRMLIDKQDNMLYDIELGLDKVIETGKKIQTTLETDRQLLLELDKDIDNTHNKLNTTRMRIKGIFKKNSNYIIVVGILIIILGVLVYFLFST